MQSNNCGQMIATFGKIDCPCQVRVTVWKLDFLHNNLGISFDTPDIRRACLPTYNRGRLLFNKANVTEEAALSQFHSSAS